MVGVLPNQKFMVTTDNLATLTTAAYLNGVSLESNPISTTDIIQVLYGFNQQTLVGTYETFTVNISNGVITLVQSSQAGEVSLPTIANNLIVSTNTSGGLANLTGTAINAGSLQAGSSGVADTFAIAPAALVSGNLLQASGTAGLVSDSAVTTASVSSAITQLGQLQQISVTLTAAQVIASYATPIVLIPAVAGKVAIVHSANVYTASTGNTAFATGVAPIIQYGVTAHGAGAIAVGTGLVTGDITAAASQVRTINAAASAAYTGTTNTAIAFSCTTAYTAGTGTTVTFTLVYELITATV
jgi:hypothetical protein